MNISLILRIFIGIVLCLAIGTWGGLMNLESLREWYPTLTKPWFNPPAIVFRPVWTLLYTLMGVALGLVLHQGWHQKGVRVAVFFFCVQLVLNWLWSYLFFGMHSTWFGLIDIAFMIVATGATIYFFSKVHTIAAWIMVPYMLWICFAAILNFELWRLNG